MSKKILTAFEQDEQSTQIKVHVIIVSCSRNSFARRDAILGESQVPLSAPTG